MGRLNNGEFLTQVGDILTQNDGKSSIYLTQKRLSPALDLDEPDVNEGVESINDLSSNVVEHKFKSNTQEYPILIRIALGSNGSKQKVKLSTVVEINNLDQFWSDYSSVIKAGFVGLKKKEKKKSKKNKISK
ncbi:hypothetical protein PSN45_002627 [Yamadazyma tenuis]|uniref:Signal recognition particle subunit SRP14 n=1 Tax=Candida tenuis (strain ATCC 10573 / BCRC 21748 / CBS 615 / JCM 9827 / NBRC 10315 / NRRL Y-1498 / VKM Y-70) TaxID=590646 RepID=G3AZT2_CANTC|nr:signal recognition particle, SRP9/SRP14 subunit [Yamadazyma tenuis ATCC 10573]EGV65234.1 signal recognition particle, SRP9/SRP14 subunit [Yamadazyma tenuis ATCC 10573]WEJ95115.1 hypothetical protein PSN45_002627 [Yamadazyma tenuis]